MTGGELGDWLVLATAEMDQRTATATAAYRALQSAHKLSSHRLINYRCSRRCLLLDVINLPQGVVAHSPAYKLSPVVNEGSSSAGGRSKNTRDGHRRWKARSYFATDAVNFALTCDHVRQVVLEMNDLQHDLEAGHAAMCVEANGERHPL